MALNDGLDRREFLKRAGALGVATTLGGASSLVSTDAADAAIDEWFARKPIRGGSAIFAARGHPVNLDPRDGQLYSSIQIMDQIFNSLLQVDSKGEFHPALAASWKQEGNKTWLLELRDDAVFHNGDRFTSADVAYTLARNKQGPAGTLLKAFYKAKPIGKYKSRIRLNKPYGPAETIMSGILTIVNQRAIESSDPKANPVGTGPFRLKEWKRGDHVTLERWNRYFDKPQPYFDETTWRGVTDDTVRLTALQTGEVDWIERVPTQRVTELLKSTQIKHSVGRPVFPTMILFNTTARPFNDKRVRQAVAWAIDREEIAKLVWFGAAVPASEATSAPNKWYTGEDPYKSGPNLDKARALLRQAGYREGLDVEYAAYLDPVNERTAQVIQSQLAKVGIRVKIIPLSGAEWFGKVAAHKYDMSTTFWSATADPVLLYGLLCYTGSQFNWTGSTNKRINELIDKFTFESDFKTRRAIYPELVRTVAEEAPLIFTTNETLRYWWRPNFVGAPPLPSLGIRTEIMWRKR